MNKYIKKIIITLLLLSSLSPVTQFVKAETMTLKAGVSLSDRVPTGFFGSWKITSVMVESSNPKMFNETSKDFWNLSKTYDVITLTNPFSGAEASVTIEEVKNNQIRFSHVIKGKNSRMIETPTLTLNGESFYGTDRIIVEKYENGNLISKDTVTYKITAEKLSANTGKNLKDIFMSTK